MTKLEKELYLIQIEGIENDVIRGKITDETFHKQMESVKETFKD